MKKHTGLVVILAILCSFTAFNPPSFVENLIKRLDYYVKNTSPEKIYIHTDKPYYSLDESIWFTAYMVNSTDHLKTERNRVMSVELINQNDTIVDTKKLYIQHTSGAGDFKIDKSWKPGKYLLRAYTSEMRNFNKSAFYQKEINILDLKEATSDETIKEVSETLEKKEAATEEIYMTSRPDLRFFPEGGYLVEGVKNKVAVKVVDPVFKNQPLNIQIVDNENNTVFSFKTIKFGLGIFLFTPEIGKNYKAIIDINGSEEEYPLPEALETGILLRASNNGSNISLGVETTADNSLENTVMVIHQRGKLLYQKVENNAKTKYNLNFPTKNLKDGIVHVTIFNNEGNPMAERLIFVENPANQIATSITTDKETIGNREKITVKVATTNTNDSIVPSSLSMVVRDLKAMPYNKFDENIKTYLLLNSDIKGKIEQPGYFFEKPNDPKRRYMLDLMMMTHGWRKFSWQAILNDSIKARKYPIEKGIYIQGKTKALKRPYDYRSVPTRLTFLGKIPEQVEQQSDTTGYFKYGPYLFFNELPILLEARLYGFDSERFSNRKVAILVENDSVKAPEIKREVVQTTTEKDKQQLKTYLKIAAYINKVNTEHLERMQELEEVIIKAKKKSEREKRDEEFDSRTLHGFSNNRLVPDDIVGAETMTIYDLLRRTPGVRVAGTSVSIRGGGSPQFYLDDMQVDSTFIENLFANDLDFIDVLTGADAAIYQNAGNGVIAMYSRTGNNNLLTRHIKRKPGIIDFKLQGYYLSREFYSPDHENGFEEQGKADLRTTLYWQPYIRTDIEANSQFSFFSGDNKGDYLIEVQGITDTGTPVYQIKTFEVN